MQNACPGTSVETYCVVTDANASDGEIICHVRFGMVFRSRNYSEKKIDADFRFASGDHDDVYKMKNSGSITGDGEFVRDVFNAGK